MPLTSRDRLVYDYLPGTQRTDKQLALVAYLERRGRVHGLVETERKLRPDIAWAHVPSIDQDWVVVEFD